MKVLITSPCSASVIIQYGIKSWPIWECEPSKFEWNNYNKEICLIIEGQTTIKTKKVRFILLELVIKLNFQLFFLRVGGNEDFKITT